MDTAKARKHMVDSQVRPNDVTDFRLQAAMLELPRERFVPADKRALAYVEQDVPLFEGRWLLKARDFAKLINEAAVQEDDLVLDIACGYGYSTAVLAKLASVVVAVEEDETVVSNASERLSDLGLDNTVVMQNPLTEGCPAQGPYDVIVIAGGVETNLKPLLKQLKEDVGRLVCIMMDGPVGHAMIYTRSGDAFGERRLFEAHPAGVIPAFKKPQAFQF
ncbi:protein-L-isoaspartate O-methyltransferase family protein [Parvularcula lutaonensis]|uniref:Protein-L-isoaspartate O-methyltransferase n=1 Tax=Parvularcula lutaonensis TaxID=491923 RepID=A0ABV7MFQ4_9PROT|nr:protein-L-isoaspartate O-methyltransferase [Parvularcula lutaonensis]GGY54103.1 protein-L-isoaspartate O-methyltransferase [Parvularcula lutaonensis]